MKPFKSMRGTGKLKRVILIERGKSRKKHPDYQVWISIRNRCLRPAKKDKHLYGHIEICKRWLDDFWNFTEDMGLRPSKKHSIDRINGKKGYCPLNCRWATAQEQSDNRRIAYECHNGHPWTKETIMLSQDRERTLKRCRICYDAYIDKNREKIRLRMHKYYLKRSEGICE